MTAAALPLPTGASTAAKQPAFGTAGTASTDVLTVQGIAGGTPQPVSGTFWQATQPVSAAGLPLPSGASTDATAAKLNVSQGASLGSNTGPMVQGSVTTAAPSYTTAQISPLSLTTAGLLRVDGSGAGALSATDTAIRAGKAFIGSTGPVGLTALLGNFRILFSNPGDSGKTAYVYLVVADNSSAAFLFATVFYNPSTVPTTGSPAINNQLAGGAAAACTIKFDSSATAVSGGTTYATIGVPGGSGGARSVYDGTTTILPAGASIGINLPFGAVASGNLIAYWYEL